MSAFGAKADIHLGGSTDEVRLSCHADTSAARPSGSRLAHQIAQVVWTIEEFASPLTARFLWRQLELISIHLKQTYEVGAAGCGGELRMNDYPVVEPSSPSSRNEMLRNVAIVFGCKLQNF